MYSTVEGCVLWYHSILFLDEMTDPRSRHQHGKDLALVFSTISAVSTL